jgi:hypothetical protein
MNRTKLLWAGLALSAACAHRAPPPPPVLPLPKDNAYFDAGRASLSEPFQGSAFDFYRSQHRTLARELSKLRAHDGLLGRETRPIWLHGDFHPLRVGLSAAGPRLVGFENADVGPWWWDLLSMEISARMLSAAESLGDAADGGCIDAFADTFRSSARVDPRVESPARIPAAPGGEPLFATASASEDALAGEEVSASLSRAFARVLPTGLTLKTARALPVVGEASDLTTGEPRYLLDTEVAEGATSPMPLRWELRAQEARPLKPLMESLLERDPLPEGAPALTGCARFLRVMKNYRPTEISRCLVSGGISYGLTDHAESRSGPRPSDFGTQERLAGHVRWMCRELASDHARQLGPQETRELGFLFAANPALRFRLRRIADQEAAKLLTAYRALLLPVTNPAAPAPALN